MATRPGRCAQLTIEIDEVRARGCDPRAKSRRPGRSAERPAHVEDDGRLVCRKSCREFVTIEQERYHSLRIPQ